MKTTGKRWLCVILGCLVVTAFGVAESRALTVTSVAPKGEVKDLTQITVRFSEPMRALGVMEQPAESSPLRLSVKGGKVPPGNFRWLDPSTLAYIFDAPVATPLAITAAVGKDARSLAGKNPEQGVSWKISTPPLALDIHNRKHITLPRKNAVFHIQANYPLHLNLLRAKLRITRNGASLPFSVSQAATSEWNNGRPSRWRHTVTIKSDLPPDSSVTVSVAQGVTAEGGGSPAGKLAAQIPTYKTLRVEAWYVNGNKVADGAKNMQPESRMYLSLNNPVLLSDALRHIAISPEADVFAKEAHPSATPHVHLPYILKPRTTYTVTLKKGLKDEYGTMLPKNETITFTTGDYHPLVHIPGGKDAILETPLADLFPVTLRNTGKFTVSLRYIPWGEEALAIMRNDRLTPAKTVSGTRETEIILDISKTPNINVREALDIPKALGFASASEMNGLVTLVAGNDALKTAGRQVGAHLQFTNLGLAVRFGEKNGLAWTANLTTGKVVKDAAIRIADANGVTLWKGKTDASGTVILPGYDKLHGARFCIAESPDGPPSESPGDSLGGTSVLDLGKYFVPASSKEYETIKNNRIPWRIHVVAQLPLYQPGQEVNATLIARRHADSGPGFGKEALDDFADWKALAKEPVSLEVRDRKNTVVHAAEGVTDAYGALPFSFTVSSSAEPGWYRVTAKRKEGEPKSSVYAFQVASFRPPDVKVDLTAPKSQPVPLKGAAPLSLDVTAGYFSGTPVKGGAVSLEVSQRESYFAPALLRGYRVGPETWPYHSRYTPPRETLLLGTLNANGKTSLALPVFTMENSRPLDVFLMATVTDAARLTTQGTASFLLHPSEYYVGIRTPFIALPNRDTPIHVKAATWENKALTGKTVTVRAERIIRAKNERKATPVWERSVILEKETGDSFTASFDESGEYHITARITDEAGRENIAVSRVYVPGPGGDWIRTKPGGRLEFLHEDTVYEPGSAARIVVKNPLGDATALVTIERDGILRSFVTEVSGEAPLIEIPLEKIDAPYVYATVTLVKGRTAPPPDSSASEGAADEGAPALAQGALLLKVAGAREKLSVTVTSDKKEYRPGGTVHVNLTVANGAGRGVKTQVTVLAVDERYLRAAGERTLYNPSATFAEQFPNAMQRADIWRHILNRAAPVSINAAMKLRAAMPSEPAPAMAAGETLAAKQSRPAGSDGDAPLRSNFTPLAFWLAAKETDDSGKLSASFTLPDTITGYRLVAVAYDAKSAFAVSETSFTASKPLQILSALPKFVTEGDKLLAAVLVQNTGKTRGRATVSAALSGDVHDSALREDTRTVSLEAGESERVSFSLDVGALTEAAGTIQLDIAATMRADGVTETDAARFALPVKPARPLTTVAAAGLLRENETFTLPVAVPADLDPRSRMVVTFAPSPAAGVPMAMKQVAAYPWNCLEQRLSRAWARILRLQHGELLGLPPDPADNAAIAEELEAVPAYQGENGAFHFWPGFRGTEGSLFLTSYALIVADAAKKTGKTLPGDTVAKALAYTESRLSGKYDAATLSPDVLALALYARALHEPGDTERLFPRVWTYCQSKETTPLGYAALLFSVKQAKLPKEAATIAAIRERIEKTAAITATETHFASPDENAYWRTLGSKLRDNAYVLAAFAATDPDYPRLENVARWVGQRLGDEPHLSTQEAVFGMWGLVSYLKALGGDRDTVVTALWNNKDEASMAFKRLMDAPAFWILAPEKLNGGNDSTLRLTAKAGRPYWTARLSYASPGLTTKVENAGFTITRTLNTEKGDWKIGDTVRVNLTVTVPATRRHVVLFDPFPAGFEPLFASRVDAAERDKTWQAPWQWQDALDDGMLLYASRIDPGTYTFTYTLRAAAAGVFIQRPAYVEEMYTPETFGRTGPGSATVSE